MTSVKSPEDYCRRLTHLNENEFVSAEEGQASGRTGRLCPLISASVGICAFAVVEHFRCAQLMRSSAQFTAQTRQSQTSPSLAQPLTLL